MTLVRWSPRREVFPGFHTEIDRVFDAFFGSPIVDGRSRRWVPAVDLVEGDNELVLRADLPGLEREDVEVEIKDGVLTVSGERKAEHEEKSDGFHRVERAYGSFSRSVRLPKGVEADAVTADFDKGVLEVHIPKPEERQPHRVQIGAGDVEGNATEK
jgi:HSP20 family protein